MDVSEIHYAVVGELRIAYQQFGSGERMVYVPPIISHIDMKWEHEYHRRVLDHLGSFMRVLHFDKRGIGLSDRFDDTPSLEDRITDIAAVMDAAGWDRAHMVGMSEGADMAQLFASRHPERVDRLVLISGCAPVGAAARVQELSGAAHRDVEEITQEFIGVANAWGEEALSFAKLMAPSKTHDVAYLRWANRLNRLSASPADFMKQLLSVGGIEAGTEPDKVAAPTLIVHLTGDRVRPIGHGRVLAELIDGATLLEVEGSDHLIYSLDNWRDVLDPVVEFLTGTRPAQSVHRHFAAIMFTDIVDSTNKASSMGDSRWFDLIERHDRACHRITALHGGRVVKSTGDGMLALFTSPSDAIEASVNLMDDLEEVGLAIRIGIHAGELEERADGDVTGLAVNLAARVEQAAHDGSIVVSSTMQQLLLGTEVKLIDFGDHVLKGIEGTWTLYEVERSSI